MSIIGIKTTTEQGTWMPNIDIYVRQVRQKWSVYTFRSVAFGTYIICSEVHVSASVGLLDIMY